MITCLKVYLNLFTGDITIGTLNKVLPYGDSIDVIELLGIHLLEVLEHSVFELDEGKTNYQLLQVSGTCM